LSLGARIGLSRTRIALGRLDDAQEALSALEPHFASTSALPHRVPEAFHEALIELYQARHAAEPNQGYGRQAADRRAKLAYWRASTRPSDP
jgi:hypothetical protein